MGSDKEAKKQAEEEALIAAQTAAATAAGYALGPDDLYKLTSRKDQAKLESLGGPEGFARGIKSDAKHGISADEVALGLDERISVCVPIFF